MFHCFYFLPHLINNGGGVARLGSTCRPAPVHDLHSQDFPRQRRLYCSSEHFGGFWKRLQGSQRSWAMAGRVLSETSRAGTTRDGKERVKEWKQTRGAAEAVWEEGGETEQEVGGCGGGVEHCFHFIWTSSSSSSTTSSPSSQVKVEDTRRAFGARLAQQVAREAQVEFSFIFSLCDVYIRFHNRLSVDTNIVANEWFLLPLNFQKYALNILMNPSISTSMNHYTIIELQTCSS